MGSDMKQRAEKFQEVLQEINDLIAGKPQIVSPAERKEMTKRELGILLADYIVRYVGNDDKESASQVCEYNSSLELGRVQWELYFLRVFTVDFAVWKVFGNCPERAVILDSCWESLLDRVHQQNIRPQLMNDINNKLLTYTKASKTPAREPKSGIVFEIGKAFAFECGQTDMDVGPIMIGAIKFGSDLGAVQTLLAHAKV